MPAEFELPRLKSTVLFHKEPGAASQGRRDGEEHSALFDVQFYPYNPPGVDPVFAVCGDRHAVVCRPSSEPAKGVEVLRWLRDEDENAQLNSLAWSQGLPACGPPTPLLLVTGITPKVKVLGVSDGKLHRTLTGHGGRINDILVSPIHPHIVATASEDHSVRIWHLDHKYEEQPIAVVYAGDGGHRDGVMSIAFHPKGKYLMSGGRDTRVSLWAVPELPLCRKVAEPEVVHFPHFSSTLVHSNVVDCIVWYGDLIISKAAKENRILLWRIMGFSSERPVPDPKTFLPAKRTSFPETRSAFGEGWHQLLTFDLPDNPDYWIRFGLFHGPDRHPILAAGNQANHVFFWDLENLEKGVIGHDTLEVPVAKRKRKRRIKARVIASESESSKSSTGTPGSEFDNIGQPLGTAFKKQKAHSSKTVPFSPTQIAWSRGGDWCAMVGHNLTICLFHRWDGKP